jgi:DNA ligase-1
MFRPMLSPREDPLCYPNYFKELEYPLLASPKYDGVRCIVKGSQCMSRTFKPLPSQHVQDQFNIFEHMDGEIIEGEAADPLCYNRTQSHVMSFNKPGDFSYNIFDYTHPDWLHKPFHERFEEAQRVVKASNGELKIIDHKIVFSEEELIAYEAECLNLGFEGIMMRNPVGEYKQGRATWKQGLIYKLKRFEDGEGVILNIREKQTNTNEQKVDELGYAKRSYEKAGMVGADTTGMFQVLFEEQELDIAPGNFTHAELQHIWYNREHYINNKDRLLKFRFMRHGSKDKPRFPRAIGFRYITDM